MGAGAHGGRVTTGWALRLPSHARDRVAAVRLAAGVMVLEATDALWLRGDGPSPQLRQALLSVPGGEFFEVDAEGHCRRPGTHLPAARLPNGKWQSLRSLCTVTLPTAAFAASAPAPLPLSLRRSEVAIEQPNALLVELRDLLAWVDHAANVRLQHLRLAVREDGKALLVGAPLPPLAGQTFVVAAGVAVPAGFTFCPACSPQLVAQHLGLQPQDLAVFEASGAYCRIEASAFVAMSRSAVRLTAEALRG